MSLHMRQVLIFTNVLGTQGHLNVYLYVYMYILYIYSMYSYICLYVYIRMCIYRRSQKNYLLNKYIMNKTNFLKSIQIFHIFPDAFSM